VPVVNFLGWYHGIRHQSVVRALSAGGSIDLCPSPPNYWHPAALFYVVSAAGNILPAIPSAGLSVVSDSTGAVGKGRHHRRVCPGLYLYHGRIRSPGMGEAHRTKRTKPENCPLIKTGFCSEGPALTCRSVRSMRTRLVGVRSTTPQRRDVAFGDSWR